MSERKKERWVQRPDRTDIVTDDGTKYHRIKPIAIVHYNPQRPEQAKDNQRNILASHNACLNIPVEALEAGIVDEMVEALTNSCAYYEMLERATGVEQGNLTELRAILAKLEK